LVITDFNERIGQPRGPHARAFVNYLWYLAWDRISINVHEWKKNKQCPEISYVSDRDKKLVWGDVLQHFTLDTNDEQLKKRVRNWSMKKMATQFQCYKKNLYNDYIKKNKTPDFNCKHFCQAAAVLGRVCIVQDVGRGSAMGEKEPRECPTQDLPPYNGIRWLPYCHS
jgi:hypothetical protein